MLGDMTAIREGLPLSAEERRLFSEKMKKKKISMP